MKNANFYLYYWSGVGYFVVNEDGTIVFGPGFGKKLPEWGDAQKMGTYFQYIGFARTRAGAIQYVKESCFFMAKNRSMEKRRKKGVVGA